MPDPFWTEEYRKKGTTPNPWVQSGREADLPLPRFLHVQRDVIQLLDLHPQHQLLDLGCANGLLDIALSALCRRLLAVEPVEELAAIARANLAACPNAEVTIGHGAAIPADDQSFDRVLVLEVIQLVPPAELPAVFRELWRVTRPGGRMVIASIPDARRRDPFLNAYLDEVRSATHLSESHKAEIIRRNLRAYWHHPDELLETLSDLGRPQLHPVPPHDPTSDHRFHMTVSVGD